MRNKYLILGLVLVAVLAIFFSKRSFISEIDFSRQVLAKLAKASQSAQGLIDWEVLKVMELDVGAHYTGLADTKEKADYRANFIKSFALGFKMSKGNLKDYVNWRIYEQDGDKTVVAADNQGKTILFTIVNSGKKRLTALQYETEGNEVQQ